MKINIDSETFGKVLAIAKKENTTVPLLVKQLINQFVLANEENNEPKRPIVAYVDAICGSGKSTTLQHYIKSSLLTNSDAIPPRYLLVMPTHELCEQVKSELELRGVQVIT